jgi:hypothetical protein
MSQEIAKCGDIIERDDGKLFSIGSFGPDGVVHLIEYEKGKSIDRANISLQSTIKNKDLDKYKLHSKINRGYGGN